jgi:hypothetical protein
MYTICDSPAWLVAESTFRDIFKFSSNTTTQWLPGRYNSKVRSEYTVGRYESKVAMAAHATSCKNLGLCCPDTDTYRMNLDSFIELLLTLNTRGEYGAAAAVTILALDELPPDELEISPAGVIQHPPCLTEGYEMWAGLAETCLAVSRKPNVHNGVSLKTDINFTNANIAYRGGTASAGVLNDPLVAFFTGRLPAARKAQSSSSSSSRAAPSLTAPLTNAAALECAEEENA